MERGRDRGRLDDLLVCGRHSSNWTRGRRPVAGWLPFSPALLHHEGPAHLRTALCVQLHGPLVDS